MKTVLCLATGETYDLVLNTGVTAHPLTRPYPSSIPEYVIPIKKGGKLEYLFQVKEIIDCYPDEICSSNLRAKNLVIYHENRKDAFGYGQPNAIYRFYILNESPIHLKEVSRKGIRVAAWMSLNDLSQ